jgi:hypothetical protein
MAAFAARFLMLLDKRPNDMYAARISAQLLLDYRYIAANASDPRSPTICSRHGAMRNSGVGWL